MKYNGILDFNTNNSLSILSKLIMPRTKVLEFGCANGRFTKYLKEELECSVFIVEIDEDSGKEAMTFAEDYLFDDIENYKWINKFYGLNFDYIIFADVLEHLYNPKEVLLNAKKLLKPNGSILVSIPNIAHNSVVIDLINNNFEYRKLGLLDDTHIRFFTYKSLENMFYYLNLHIEKKYAVYLKASETEFENDYTDVKGIDSSYWKNREYGEVYQFIYDLKILKESTGDILNNIVEIPNYYYFQLYFGENLEFSENRSITKNINFRDKTNFYCEIELESFEYEYDCLRVDLINTSSIIQINYISAVTESNEIIQFNNFDGHNAFVKLGTKYFFDSDDPQILIKLPLNTRINKLMVNIDYECIDYFAISKCIEYLNVMKDLLMFNKGSDIIDVISEKNEEIKSLKQNISSIQNLNKEYNTSIQIKNKKLVELESELTLMTEKFDALNKEYSNNIQIKELIEIEPKGNLMEPQLGNLDIETVKNKNNTNKLVLFLKKLFYKN